ncbi:methionine ABC transporter permease [Novibacillus thermophilus]|uniref:Metal ABC transporter permease n=1 Tax=Novibacillus thermophilus TaxID=1471761 RepID=A0A1U9K754_9BACL|nr:methionine ABC transporter permease [Novibacillus thermophilus]AQS55850.1 metal ABC transporter permease [Novibacillus thermophilus]
MDFLLPNVQWDLLLAATWETVYMMVISTFFTALFGLPLGIALVVMEEKGLWPLPWLQRLVGFGVNLFRSIPFIVLVVWMIPVARMLVGTSLGPTAACVSLVVGAAPFYARLVETSLREVDKGVIEAARAMGATRWQIIRKVYIPEALPGLVAGITVTCITLVSYSAITGILGGGGLGDLAYRFGFQSFQTDVMVLATAVLVLMVQIIQSVGDRVVQAIDKR